MSALRSDIEALLVAARLDPDAVMELARRALEEDLDGGVDVTTQATVPPGQRAVLDLVARKPGVAAGVPVAAAVFCVVSSAFFVRFDAVDCNWFDAAETEVTI